MNLCFMYNRILFVACGCEHVHVESGVSHADDDVCFCALARYVLRSGGPGHVRLLKADPIRKKNKK